MSENTPADTPDTPATALEAPNNPPAGLIAALSDGPNASANAQRLVEAFLRGRNRNTLRAYARDLEHFATYLGVSGAIKAAGRLLSCSAGDANALVLAYRSTMLEAKLATNTLNRRLASIRSLIKLAKTLGIVSWSLEIEGLRADPYRDTRGAGRTAIAAILERTKKRGDAKGFRDAAIICLLHDCGLRRGEVVAIDVEDFDAATSRLAIKPKGRTEKQIITLPPSTKAAIETWLEMRDDSSGPLFHALDGLNYGHRLDGGSVYTIVRALGDAVGARVRPHGIRHTAITTVLDRTNGNVRLAQQFSRHRNVQTVLTYDDHRRDDAGRAAGLIALDAIEASEAVEAESEASSEAESIDVEEKPSFEEWLRRKQEASDDDND